MTLTLRLPLPQNADEGVSQSEYGDGLLLAGEGISGLPVIPSFIPA